LGADEQVGGSVLILGNNEDLDFIHSIIILTTDVGSRSVRHRVPLSSISRLVRQHVT
jgi:hypothetical protein